MSTSLIFVIAPAIILLVILVGGLLAWVTAGFDSTVKKNQEQVEKKDHGYNLSQTYGYRIKINADPAEQIQEARREAARLAAATPRGANAPSAHRGMASYTAGDQEALQHDPFTAAKIAAIHSWDGVHTGFIAAPTAPAVGAAPTAVPTGPIKLVPGKDYPVIEITDDMSPDEKRKARIANAKAKSAAMKKAKATQQAGGVAPVAAAPAAGQPIPAAAPAAAAPVDIEPPQLVEITDDMTPDEKRKARIANSKAKSAFNKQLKAAGIDPKKVEIKDGKVVLPAGAAPVAAPAAPAAAVPQVATPAPAPDQSAALADIPKPELIEITDDMSPDEKRQARIANSKAKSAYNKALKAAGIDPKSVK